MNIPVFVGEYFERSAVALKPTRCIVEPSYGSQQKDNAGWAQENGYEFHAESQGVISEGARSLDIFRRAESFQGDVLGVHRNRPFEILDTRFEESDSTGFFFVWNTVVVIPTTGLNLPNFDLLLRRETGG